MRTLWGGKRLKAGQNRDSSRIMLQTLRCTPGSSLTSPQSSPMVLKWKQTISLTTLATNILLDSSCMVQMKGDTSFQLGNMEEGDMSKQQHRVPCRWWMMGSLQTPISPILHSKHWPGKLPWKSPLPKLGATGHRVCSRHLFHLYNKPYENRVCACTAYQHTQDAGRHRNALLLMSIRSHWKLSMCLQKKTKSSSAFHSLFPGPPTTVMLWVPTEYANKEIFSWLKVWVASSLKQYPFSRYKY